MLSAIKWYEPQKQTKTELRSPLYFFQKYYTEDLFDTMVQHTNLYAVQQHARFVPTNRNEIKTFVGIHILMGNLNYPRLRCYWENKLKIPMISESMPRNRFSQLRTHLHFVNVLEKPPDCNDGFWKVRILFETLRNRMLELGLENKLSIDEQMVPFKGKINVKQYIKGNPCPWGIKIFAICGTSGIMYDLLLYQGSSTEINQQHSEVSWTRCSSCYQAKRQNKRKKYSAIL